MPRALTFEQRGPARLLELEDIFGHGRLAGSESNRRRSQAAAIGNGEELVQ